MRIFECVRASFSVCAQNKRRSAESTAQLSNERHAAIFSSQIGLREMTFC